MEQEEVVTNQFHLVERVVNRHRFGGVFLGPHDLTRAVSVIDLGTVVTVCTIHRGGRREGIGGQNLGGLGERYRRLISVVNLAAVTASAQSALQLGNGRFERTVERVGTRLAPDDRSPAPRGDLHALTDLLLATVLFVFEFYIKEVNGFVVPFQTGQFVVHKNSEMIGDIYVSALDHDIGLGRPLPVLDSNGCL